MLKLKIDNSKKAREDYTEQLVDMVNYLARTNKGLFDKIKVLQTGLDSLNEKFEDLIDKGNLKDNELCRLNFRVTAVEDLDNRVGKVEDLFPFIEMRLNAVYGDLHRVDDMNIDDVRTVNCLRNNSIIYMEQLCMLTYEDLIRWPNFGRKSFNILKDYMIKSGLEFKKSVKK